VVLTDSQIERYSRQIILPEIGGRGQELLLGARLRLVAESDLIEEALAYLVGAGVGSIAIGAARLPPEQQISLRTQMRELNSDVEIEADHGTGAEFNLDLRLISGPASLEAALKPSQTKTIVAARLDRQPLVALIRSRPPCLRCIDEGFLKPIHDPGDEARTATMIALTEAIKILASGAATEQVSKLIRIRDYSASVEAVRADRHCAGCRPTPSVE
jgi:molybdopterin/thiamine biosynthesis adenylyltransferase